MFLAIVFLLFSYLLSPSSTLTCLPCCSDRESGFRSIGDRPSCATCSPLSASECKSGQLTKGICSCCNVCAKAEGETCGGPWNIDGVCADNFFCDKSKEEDGTKLDFYDDFNASGVCRAMNPSPEVKCCQERIVKRSGENDVLESITDVNVNAFKSWWDEFFKVIVEIRALKAIFFGIWL